MRKTIFSRKQKKIYRLLLCAGLIINTATMGMWYYYELDKKIPSHIYIFKNEKCSLEFKMPVFGECSVAETSSHLEKALGKYEGEAKLFGIIPYKKINFEVISREKVMPSGRAVGLYLQSDGIMVLGTSKIIGEDGFSYEPAKDVLQPGDRIYKVDNRQVENIDDIIAILQEKKKGKVVFDIIRDKNLIKVRVENILAKDEQYKIGVWMREDTEGIGTLTFITSEGQYAALGHGITDVDTGKLIPLESGEVYPAKIEDIEKGKSGAPGELVGSVTLGATNRIGDIESNTGLGISGSISNNSFKFNKSKALQMGLKQEVKRGEAWILCELDKGVEKFRINIDDLDVNSNDNKGMVIRITDERLLKRTGGIVQGMFTSYNGYNTRKTQ